MIGGLIRQDSAFGQMHVSQILALSTGVALLLIPELPQQFARYGTNTQGWGFVPIYALICAMFLFFVVTTNIGQRCSRLSLVLPVSARKLWYVRIVSIIIVSLIPVAIVTLVATLSFRGAEGRIPEAIAWRLGLHTGAGLILAAMLLQSFSPKLYRVGWHAGYIVYTIAISFVVLGLMVAGMRSAVVSVLFLAASVILAVRIYRLIPQSFVLLPKQPVQGTLGAGGQAASAAGQSATAPAGGQRDAQAEDGKSTERAGKISAALVHRLCFTIIMGRWQVWLSLILLGFYSALIVLSYYEGQRDNPYPLFMIVWISGSLITAIYNLHKIDFLPISRKTLLSYAFGSSIVVMLIGFIIGNAIVAGDRTRYKQLSFYQSTIHIPDDFWEITTDGEPPLLSSPWGETYAPEAYTLYRGSSIVIYKPFDCGSESSDRFVAMQIDRAAAAVYGAPFDPSDRYEDIGDSETTGERTCCAAIDEYAGHGSPLKLRSYTMGTMLFALLYIILFWVTLRSSRTTGRRSIMQKAIPIAVILALLVILAILAAGAADVMHPRAVAKVPSILTRMLGEAVPLGTPVLWVIIVALCMAGYLAIQAEFMKIEAPCQRQKPFLGDY